MEPENSRISNFVFLRNLFLTGLAGLYLLMMIPVAGAGNEKTVALVMKALSNPFFFKMDWFWNPLDPGISKLVNFPKTDHPTPPSPLQSGVA